jgi:hypothetical protein
MKLTAKERSGINRILYLFSQYKSGYNISNGLGEDIIYDSNYAVNQIEELLNENN